MKDSSCPQEMAGESPWVSSGIIMDRATTTPSTPPLYVPLHYFDCTEAEIKHEVPGSNLLTLKGIDQKLREGGGKISPTATFLSIRPAPSMRGTVTGSTAPTRRSHSPWSRRGTCHPRREGEPSA